MVQVLVEFFDINVYGFDMWIFGYVVEDNFGFEFVCLELEKLGIKKQLILIRGDFYEMFLFFFVNLDNF